jgi:hypothetical protein
MILAQLRPPNSQPPPKRKMRWLTRSNLKHPRYLNPVSSITHPFWYFRKVNRHALSLSIFLFQKKLHCFHKCFILQNWILFKNVKSIKFFEDK